MIQTETLRQALPYWNQLSKSQQELLCTHTRERTFARGETVNDGARNCAGLLLVLSGQLRIFIVTEEGREITLYRLLDRDMCLLSAGCIFKNLQYDPSIHAEQETRALQIPPEVFKQVNDASAPAANYTAELMMARFSDVMWLLDEILSRKLDSRLAALLLEESRLSGGPELELTHEQIAHHLGSAREVISRMMKYFQNEGLLQSTRGKILLTDEARIQSIADER